MARSHRSWPRRILNNLRVLFDTLLMRFFALGLPAKPLHPSIAAKTVIITGPTSGIGLAAAREFGVGGAHVILACRNTAQGNKLAEEWTRELGLKGDNARMQVMELDVSSLASVRAFAKKVQEQCGGKIDVLVNNAGIFNMGQRTRKETCDGHEEHLQVNYLSHFLLTALLMPSLKRAGAGARVVHVSSITHLGGSIDTSDMDYKRGNGFSPSAAYSRSKLAQIMGSTFELQRRLSTSCPNVNVFAVHPGTVRTAVVRTLPKFVQIAYHLVGQLIFLSPLEGAATTLFCASQPSLNSSGGLYMAYCRPSHHDECADDRELCASLWKWSCDTVGLDENWAEQV